MRTSRLLIAAAITASMMAVGCKSYSTLPTTGDGGPISYGDPEAVETINIFFGSTDLKLISEKMVAGLLTTDVLHDRPTITISTLRNKTSEYIDMENIMSTIQTQLIKSGKVRFVRSTREMQAAVDELDRQNTSGYYDPNQTAAIGRMVGARYMLEGDLTSINKVAGKKGDIYYKFTLKLIDTEQGTIDWMEEKDIRKSMNAKK